MKIKKTQKGQRTPVGNDRGERWLASSPGRSGHRQMVFAGSGLEAMALGVSWMGWRHHPAAGHRQQRWGYSGRTSERGHHVAVGRVTLGCRATKNWVCGGLDCFGSVAGGLRCAKDNRRPRCGCSGGSTSRNGGFSPLDQPTTWHQLAWPASVTHNKPCLGGQTPQNEYRCSTKFDRESIFLLLC